MSSFEKYNPRAQDAVSSPIAGMSNGLSQISDILDLKTAIITDMQMTEIYTEIDDRFRLFDVPMEYKGWLASPAPVIKKNGAIITPESDFFKIHHLGGAIEFTNIPTRPIEGDVITVSATYIIGETNKPILELSEFKGTFSTKLELESSITNPQNNDFAFVLNGNLEIYAYNETLDEWGYAITASNIKVKDEQGKYNSDNLEDVLGEIGASIVTMNYIKSIPPVNGVDVDYLTGATWFIPEMSMSNLVANPHFEGETNWTVSNAFSTFADDKVEMVGSNGLNTIKLEQSIEIEAMQEIYMQADIKLSAIDGFVKMGIYLTNDTDKYIVAELASGEVVANTVYSLFSQFETQSNYTALEIIATFTGTQITEGKIFTVTRPVIVNKNVDFALADYKADISNYLHDQIQERFPIEIFKIAQWWNSNQRYTKKDETTWIFGDALSEATAAAIGAENVDDGLMQVGNAVKTTLRTELIYEATVTAPTTINPEIPNLEKCIGLLFVTKVNKKQGVTSNVWPLIRPLSVEFFTITSNDFRDQDWFTNVNFKNAWTKESRTFIPIVKQETAYTGASGAAIIDHIKLYKDETYYIKAAGNEHQFNCKLYGMINTASIGTLETTLELYAVYQDVEVI